MDSSLITHHSSLHYEDLIGIPYQQDGRDPKNGLDCWGVIVIVQRRLGIEIADVFKAENQITVKVHQTGTEALDWIASLFGRWRRVDPPQERCVVVFRDVGGAAVHAGVLVDYPRFIHATRAVGVGISSLTREPWASSFLGAYAYNESIQSLPSVQSVQPDQETS